MSPPTRVPELYPVLSRAHEGFTEPLPFGGRALPSASHSLRLLPSGAKGGASAGRKHTWTSPAQPHKSEVASVFRVLLGGWQRKRKRGGTTLVGREGPWSFFRPALSGALCSAKANGVEATK